MNSKQRKDLSDQNVNTTERGDGEVGWDHIKALQIIKKVRLGFYFKCNEKLIFPILGNGNITNLKNLKFFLTLSFI